MDDILQKAKDAIQNEDWELLENIIRKLPNLSTWKFVFEPLLRTAKIVMKDGFEINAEGKIGASPCVELKIIEKVLKYNELQNKTTNP